MDDERVFELARTLGRVPEEDWEALRTLCAQAAGEVADALRPEVTPGDCAGAYRLGCAWTALALLCVAGAAEGVESFTAGGLTIRHGDGADALARAAALRRQAERALLPYLRDRGFAFRRVEA